jgi:hypothetical protein
MNSKSSKKSSVKQSDGGIRGLTPDLLEVTTTETVVLVIFTVMRNPNLIYPPYLAVYAFWTRVRRIRNCRG